MDSLGYFIVTMLSLAVIHSMFYNSRRLETIGYALSIAFLQQLILGNEDIFLMCPQFPLYVSPRDQEPSPDKTLPDPEASGVYVDHALLLPRAEGNEPRFSKVFSLAHQKNDHCFYRTLHIPFLEVPLLEERKRAPTRHPSDLEDHVWSILNALRAAQSQVATQARILFSSPRFAAQDLVILVASAGEYYCLSVLSRGHRGLEKLPTSDEVADLLPGDPGDPSDVADHLVAELVRSAHSPGEQEAQRVAAMEKARNDDIERQKKDRDARAVFRQQRKDTEDDVDRKVDIIIENAGDPKPNPPYSDEWIETYYKAYTHSGLSGQSSTTFFERKPSRHETVTTLAKLRDLQNDREVVFTGVIRLGSPTSNMYLDIIRKHLSTLARIERSRRR